MADQKLGNLSDSATVIWPQRDPDVAFWNRTVVDPLLDIKYGFNDTTDYQHFESQVPVMDSRLQNFKQVCLKGPSSQYLTCVGTTATVHDFLASIAEYFDDKGCDMVSATAPPSETISSTVGCSFHRPHPELSHLSSVFPTSVGRIILDGVEDPITHNVPPTQNLHSRS